MNRLARLGRAFVLVSLFGAAVYGGAYFLSASSEAFDFIAQKVRHSPAVEARVGKVRKVRLDPLGPFESKSWGDDERATMTVEISGVAGDLTLEVTASKSNTLWKVESALDGKQKLNLNAP